MDWTPSDRIRPDEARNSLTAVCVRDYLALYANGALLAETTDDTDSDGKTGLTVNAWNDDNIDVQFDDLYIWEATLDEPSP